MKIELKRIFTCKTYTIGHIYVDGKFVCDSIEDTDRGLLQTTPLDEIKAKKVYAETAIPRGTYKVTLNIQSPSFSKKAYYKQFCNGYLPRLLRVPGFDGILMHRGTTAKSSAGCIICGYNKVKGQVVDSEGVGETDAGLPAASSEEKRVNNNSDYSYVCVSYLVYCGASLLASSFRC